MRLLLLTFLFSSLLHAAEIPDFRLKDLDHRPQNYSELRGEKLTLIDFWATWCKPCIQAIPKLNKLYREYKDNGVELLGINVDGPRNSAKVKPFSKIHKISYPVLRDPNAELAADLNINSYPTLLIVNSKNEVVYTHRGFRPGDEKILKEKIDTLLAANEE